MCTIVTNKVVKMRPTNAVWGVKLSFSCLFIEIRINTTFWKIS